MRAPVLLLYHDGLAKRSHLVAATANAARGLRLMRGTAGGHDVLVATTHLESPLGNNDMRSSERRSQMQQVHATPACAHHTSTPLAELSETWLSRHLSRVMPSRMFMSRTTRLARSSLLR